MNHNSEVPRFSPSSLGAAVLLLVGVSACSRPADPVASAKAAALNQTRQRGFAVQRVVVHSRPETYVLGINEKDFAHVMLTLANGSHVRFVVEKEASGSWRVRSEEQCFSTAKAACDAATQPRVLVEVVRTDLLLYRGKLGLLQGYLARLADGSGVSLSIWEDIDGLYAVRETLRWLSPSELQQALASPSGEVPETVKGELGGIRQSPITERCQGASAGGARRFKLRNANIKLRNGGPDSADGRVDGCQLTACGRWMAV